LFCLSSMSSDPSEILSRLRASVRKFWGKEEAKFEKVWEVLAPEGKEKFAKAVVEASKQMCGDKYQLLVPELEVAKIVEEPKHISQLFWYYYTNDGVERDRSMMEDWEEAEMLEMPIPQACALRQMAILRCLNQCIEVYTAIWSKGTSNPSATNQAEVKQALTKAQQSFQNNTCIRCGKANSHSLCARCQKVKYCSRECQKEHWKEHKQFCVPTKQNEDEAAKEALKKKLELAKKQARDRSDQAMGKIKNSR